MIFIELDIIAREDNSDFSHVLVNWWASQVRPRLKHEDACRIY
jgi:hypothetical protein